MKINQQGILVSWFGVNKISLRRYCLTVEGHNPVICHRVKRRKLGNKSGDQSARQVKIDICVFIHHDWQVTALRKEEGKSAAD